MEPIYLDNAATSHPKPDSVYRAVLDTMKRGGSSGRGSHSKALSSDRLIFETRELLAEMFNIADSARISFTANATIAINQALFGLLRPGDRVVTTTMEHNAVARPLHRLQGSGVEVVKVEAGRDGLIDPEQLKQACLAETSRLLVVNHCSNVVGAIQPIDQLGSWCREHNILFMVDGSQSAGAFPIDLQALSIDLFAAPGHKRLLGPAGTGFLYVGEGIDLEPLIFGGTGADSKSAEQPDIYPERLESGTLNVPGLAGLREGLLYLQEEGLDAIRKRDIALTERLLDGLGAIDSAEIYGPDNIVDRSEVISFNLKGVDPAEVGFILDRQWQIAVRVGLHCAPDAHRTIGTFPTGTVRVSPGCYTTDSEIDRFLQAVEDIAAGSV